MTNLEKKLFDFLGVGLLGAFLISGCQKQIVQVNVDDPEKTIVKIDKKRIKRIYS